MNHCIVLQFRTNAQTLRYEQESILRSAQANRLPVIFVDALDEALSWDRPGEIVNNAAGIVLGGSGDFDFDGGRDTNDPARIMSQTLLNRLTPLFEYIFERDIPTLAICYGHQIMGAFQGVQVVHDTAQAKIGTHTIRLLVEANDHFLFADIPKELEAQYGHKDVLSGVPDTATLIASGRYCKVAALRYQNNIYSVQFHPEMSAEDVSMRLMNSPGYLPEGSTIEEMIRPSLHAERMLHNFFAHIVTLDSKKDRA